MINIILKANLFVQQTMEEEYEKTLKTQTKDGSFVRQRKTEFHNKIY